MADDLGRLYRMAREQVEELVRSLGAQELDTPVPACPGWTVHGVVSHLAGVATDVINGRLRGMPDAEQTAAQLRERADTPTSIVLREWERTGSQLEALLSKAGNRRTTPVVDVAVHEQDIRGALAMPGNREGPLVDLAVNDAAQVFLSKVESAGLAPIKVATEAAPVPVIGDETAPVTLRASRYELFRAMYGRRSRAQLRKRLLGTEEPDAYIDLLCLLEPTEEDILE